MFKPDVYLSSVLQVTPKLLTNIKVFAVIVDVDNTIRHYGKAELVAGVLNWVDGMKRCGIPLAIASNNFKRNIKPVANMLGIPYVSFSFKPLPIGLKKAAKMLGVNNENIAVVGDQFFTDVIGGKLQGFKTILVEPLSKEKGFLWKFRRSLENIVLHKSHISKEDVF